MYQLIRPFLFSLPAETAHHLTLRLLSAANRIGLLKRILPEPGMSAARLTVMGIQFPNRVGLAAGLDKNGEYIDALGRLGFGFVEIGTVTPRPQPGNPKPRLFRVKSAGGVINRMGFNNKGVDNLLENVEKSSFEGVLGINIGKNFDTPVENAVDDYLICMRKVYVSADYITVNISSPNTPGLRNLQYGKELDRLLAALKREQAALSKKHHKYVPMAVKVAPDLTDEEIRNIAEILLANAVDGLIATNTTLSREGVEHLPNGNEQGGLSGEPLKKRSTEIIAKFYSHLQDTIPIVGVGGISCGQDAKDKLEAGAVLVQLYSGLVYKGPELVKQVVVAT